MGKGNLLATRLTAGHEDVAAPSRPCDGTIAAMPGITQAI